MSQKKVLSIWVFNCLFFGLNFYLWAYNSPGTEIDRFQKLSDSFSVEESLIEKHARMHRLSPKEGEHFAESFMGIPSISGGGVVKQWEESEQGQQALAVVKPKTDAYLSYPIGNKTMPKMNLRDYVIPKIKYTELVNCAVMLKGDEAELKRAQAVMIKIPKQPIYDETYLEWTQNCPKFRAQRGYVEVPLSEEEENYPLAFSIAMYTDVEQTERLLRAIYQPQNLYCIHIDTKSPLLLHRTMQSLVRCFPNVFIASHLDKIKWGDVSVLLPAINCMRDMVRRYKGRWKYFINLTGQEMPLRTNWELVQIAKIFNGSNDIGGSVSRMEKARVDHLWTHRWSKTYQQTIFYDTMQPKTPFRLDLTFVKGELHGLFTHRMVEYIIEDPISQEYLEWCWDSGHPSEHYWNVLNYNKKLKAPGGYEGPSDLADQYAVRQVIRAKNWVGHYDNRECQGKVVRGICVYGAADTPWLATRPELFANKFHLTFQYLGYDCLEERHRNRTMLREKVNLDREFYENLPTVKFSRKDGLD